MSISEFNLEEHLLKLGISLAEEKLSKLDQFLRILFEANRFTNLTSIDDYAEAQVKHIYDTLMLLTLPAYQSAKTIIDIGSGGGIPSLPLAICNPEKRVVSLDSTQKKINFQNSACQELQIDNLLPIWGRAEELARLSDHREQYDLVTARAVASVNILAELTIPFAKLHGSIIFYKGKGADEELQQGENAIQLLGGEMRRTIPYELPCQSGSRVLIHIQKKAATDSRYPRKPGIPQKKPL